MSSNESTRFLLSKLHELGYPESCIFLEFHIQNRKVSLFADLAVISSREKNGFLFEICNAKSRPFPYQYHQMLNQVNSRNYTQFEFLLIHENRIYILRDHNWLDFEIPQFIDWDLEYSSPNRKSIILVGQRSIPSIQLLDYLNKTINNYNKISTIILLTALFESNTITNSNVLLFRGKSKPISFEDQILTDYSQHESISYIGDKENPDVFWRNFHREHHPIVLIKQEDKLRPVVDVKTQDIKVRRIDVESPPFIDLEGLAKAVDVLFYASERRAEEREATQLRNQKTRIEILHEIVNLERDIHSLPPTSPLRKYLLTQLEVAVEKQNKLSEETGVFVQEKGVNKLI